MKDSLWQTQSADSIAAASICLPTLHPLSRPLSTETEVVMKWKRNELLRPGKSTQTAASAGQRLRRARSDKRKWQLGIAFGRGDRRQNYKTKGSDVELSASRLDWRHLKMGKIPYRYRVWYRYIYISANKQPKRGSRHPLKDSSADTWPMPALPVSLPPQDF